MFVHGLVTATGRQSQGGDVTERHERSPQAEADSR
jgi:hypothetical protein